MSSRGWILFSAVSVLWGIPYALIKVAVDDGVPPATLAVARTSIGALLLLVLAWRAGVLGSVRGRLRWLTVYAIAEIAVPFPLLAVGERHTSSSLAAILIATAPLFVAVLALRFDPSERLNRRRAAGLGAGLLGVVALVGIDVGGQSGLLRGTAAVLAVALCYAVAPMILKRHLGDLDPRASMGASLGIASLLLSPAIALDRPAGAPPAHALYALVGLGVLCTAAALSLYAALVAEVGAGRALVVTYLNPVVAIALGITVLGERPGPGALAGLILILAGAWFATDGRAPAPVSLRERGGTPYSDEPAQQLDLLPEASANSFAECEHAFVDDPVVRKVPLLALGNDAGLLQHAEMLGDVLLRGADRGGEVQHGRLTLAEAIEQLDPGRLGEHAKARRDVLDQVIGKRMRDGHPCLFAAR